MDRYLLFLHQPPQKTGADWVSPMGLRGQEAGMAVNIGWMLTQQI